MISYILEVSILLDYSKYTFTTTFPGYFRLNTSKYSITLNFIDMKTFKHLLLSGLMCFIILVGVNSLSVAQDFEGVIHYEIPEMTKQGMGQMPYMVKNGKVRMEFGKGNQGGAMIFMPEENKMAVIMEAMKGYMTMEIDDPETKGDIDNNTNMKSTGDTKTIAGKSCEIWEVNDPNNSYRLCVAKGMGNFMMPQNPMAKSNTPQWAKEAMAGGFMPLEVIETGGGKEDLKMRATRIEEKSLSASLFEIPEGYNDMSSMMKQMMNQN